jgi:hypothetical protein
MNSNHFKTLHGRVTILKNNLIFFKVNNPGMNISDIRVLFRFEKILSDHILFLESYGTVRGLAIRHVKQTIHTIYLRGRQFFHRITFRQ